MASESRLLSIRELAEYLGVSTSTVYSWRHQQKGPPACRVGGLVKYRLSDVERWLEQNTETRGDR